MAKKSAPKSTKKPANAGVQQTDVVKAAAIALLLGLGLGFGFTNAFASDTDDHSSDVSQSEKAEDEHSHTHDELFEVTAEQAPKLELVVSEDKKAGYNVKLVTTNFTFTPEKIDGDTIVGEGHAHLYVDGIKVGRLYDEYFHYDGSFEGTRTFRATLNANDHSEYAVDGEVIAAEVVVTHDSSDPDHAASHDDDDHSHDDNTSDMQ